MNIKLQKDLFNYYTEVLNLQYKNKNNNIKENRTKLEYEDRWDFNANYIVNKNVFLIQDTFINNECIYEKTKITDNSYEFIENSLDKVFKDYQNYYNDDFSQMDKPFITCLENTNTSSKQKYEIIIDKNKKILESIFVI